MKINSKLKEAVLLRNRISSSGVVTQTRINATFTVKGKGLMVQTFLRMLIPIGLSKTLARAKTILFFLTFCQNLYNTQGMKGLVNYLKASQVLLQQSLGGFRLHDVTELKCRPSRNRAGLPRLIRPQDRALIRADDWRVAKFYMTLFALFRVLEFPGKVSLNTITGPFTGNYDDPLYKRIIAYAKVFAKMLKAIARETSVLPLENRGISPSAIVKSAPGTGPQTISTSPWVLAGQAFNLKRLGLDETIEYFMKYFQKGTKVPFPGLLSVFQGAANLPMGLIPSLAFSVGRLGFKEEAAGKVRVFAMADAWTQWSLEPLHSYLFDILRGIPMDGTFDQLKPVRAKASSATAAYSLDLTAATDRLPMSVQIELFSSLFSREFAVQWARLLVGRSYNAFSHKFGVNEELTYSVGQPMGALSSWASLAITHHFLVQCAAWEAEVVKPGHWFTEYAILGDDLVIFDARVKRQYLLIVGVLGVQCGIAKSLLSPAGLAIEFAKRTLWKGRDVSPVPLMEFIAANLTLSDAITFARKYTLTFPQLLRVLGYGYRVVGSYTKHVGKLNSRVRALMFAFYLLETEDQVRELLMRGNPLLSKATLTLVVNEFKSLIGGSYLKRLESAIEKLPNPATLIREQGEKAMAVFLNRIYMVPALVTYLDKVLPTALSTTAVSVDVKADEFLPFLGLRRPAFTFPREEDLLKEGLPIHVPGSLFNRIEQQVRLWRLCFERLVKLVVAEPMSRFRTDASKISYEIHAIRYGRDLVSLYSRLMTVQRLLSKAGTGLVPLEKIPERMPWGQDPVQMRFWRDFTKSILKVLKSMKTKA